MKFVPLTKGRFAIVDDKIKAIENFKSILQGSRAFLASDQTESGKRTLEAPAPELEGISAILVLKMTPHALTMRLRFVILVSFQKPINN